MSVKGVLTKWYERHLGNPEAVVFIFFLLFGVPGCKLPTGENGPQVVPVVGQERMGGYH